MILLGGAYGPGPFMSANRPVTPDGLPCPATSSPMVSSKWPLLLQASSGSSFRLPHSQRASFQGMHFLILCLQLLVPSFPGSQSGQTAVGLRGVKRLLWPLSSTKLPPALGMGPERGWRWQWRVAATALSQGLCKEASRDRGWQSSLMRWHCYPHITA